MGCKRVFAFVFIVLLIGMTSASFLLSGKGSSIVTTYGTSSSLKANINISFQNEYLNSVFNDSLGNKITLENLLYTVPEYAYEFNDTTQTAINSDFNILKFDAANFSLPNIAENFTYQLNFSGYQIFKRPVVITSIGGAVKDKIDEKYSKLNVTKTEIKTYDLQTQNVLNEFLNITSIESDLKKVQTQYGKAKTDLEYSGVLTNLSYIKVPEGISKTIDTNPITFIPNKETINLDALESIGGGDYGEEEQAYIEAIFLWSEENLKTNISFEEVSINYESGPAIAIKIFKFEFDKETENDAYFIVKDMSDLKFYDNIPLENSGYYYVNLSDVSDSIIFSTTEDVNFINVPVFISPSLENINPNTVITPPPFKIDTSKWWIFALILFILILIAIIVYIILQRWYRRKYENYLFKNRNNLFNIMTYIQTAKKKGMERGEILKNLKKADWTREQINYALQKYEGKKIAGIIDRPFKKVMQEMERIP